MEYATNSKAKSTAIAVTGAAGYGITTILMAVALKIVEATHGPVFMLREGAEVTEGDVAYAATLFPDVACYFIVDQAREHATNVAGRPRTAAENFNCLFVLGERRNNGYRPEAVSQQRSSSSCPFRTADETVC